jgi:hypothetical protein
VANGNWLEGTPRWFQTGAVIVGLLSFGAASGKTVADYSGHAALLAEAKLLRQEVHKQTCIQVSQLRHTDWTLCIQPQQADGTNQSPDQINSTSAY